MSELQTAVKVQRIINRTIKSEQEILRLMHEEVLLDMEADRVAKRQKFHKMIVALLEARGQLTVRGFIGRGLAQGWAFHALVLSLLPRFIVFGLVPLLSLCRVRGEPDGQDYEPAAAVGEGLHGRTGNGAVRCRTRVCDRMRLHQLADSGGMHAVRHVHAAVQHPTHAFVCWTCNARMCMTVRGLRGATGSAARPMWWPRFTIC